MLNRVKRQNQLTEISGNPFPLKDAWLYYTDLGWGTYHLMPMQHGANEAYKAFLRVTFHISQTQTLCLWL